MARPLTDITGIGPAAAALLQAAGFASAEDVAQSTPDALSTVRGFGPARSATIIKSATALCGKPAQKPKEDHMSKKKDKKKDKKKEIKAKAKKEAAKAKAKVKAKKKAKAKKASKKDKKGKKKKKK